MSYFALIYAKICLTVDMEPPVIKIKQVWIQNTKFKFLWGSENNLGVFLIKIEFIKLWKLFQFISIHFNRLEIGRYSAVQFKTIVISLKRGQCHSLYHDNYQHHYHVLHSPVGNNCRLHKWDQSHNLYHGCSLRHLHHTSWHRSWHNNVLRHDIASPGYQWRQCQS